MPLVSMTPMANENRDQFHYLMVYPEVLSGLDKYAGLIYSDP